jgi:TDG/mug DNA glycosylase family protein
METSDGFPPIERPDARILVLGSLPGRKSIAEQQYYAHPQNAFWPIIREVFGIEGEYHHRCIQLSERQVALWDVLKSSERPGSLDSDIRMSSAQPNDFEMFFKQHPAIERVAFNGRKAEQMFMRFVAPAVTPRTVGQIGLPSTSPAYAAMPFSGKLAAWRNAFLPLLK